MGVTITATNSRLSFDIGYGGFFNLRKNIAYALDRQLGDLYACLPQVAGNENACEEYDRRVNAYLKRSGLGDRYEDVIDFLYSSDCDGEVSYKTCGRIFEIIKDVNFEGKCFRYAAYAHNDYDEFKRFLRDCYARKRKMRWF
jgi:hypothetical protein